MQIQAQEHQGPATLLSISSLYKTLSQAPQALQTFVSHFVTAGLHSLIHSNFHRAFNHVLQLRMFQDLQFFLTWLFNIWQAHQLLQVVPPLIAQTHPPPDLPQSFGEHWPPSAILPVAWRRVLFIKKSSQEMFTHRPCLT